MTKKQNSKQDVAPATRAFNVLAITEQPGKSRELQMAEAVMSPLATNAFVAQRFASEGGDNPNVLGVTEAFQVMNAAAAAVRANDMSGPEAILVSQAIALNSMFAELARRAALQLGTRMEATEMYVRLALKAQAQSRATIEALGALKNPPIVYAKQANFAAGHQQVNNGFPAQAGIETSQTKLLERQDGERLDSGAQSTTSGADSQMATVGEIYGTAIEGGQAASRAKRVSGREAPCDAKAGDGASGVAGRERGRAARSAGVK